ncbi:hypothetical protein PSAB6_230396 [Paraburkholderia sabiae]|nr:hypothetical protein PSAB6_230396 [Paraburkholderia sabiae]
MAPSKNNQRNADIAMAMRRCEQPVASVWLAAHALAPQ